MRLEKQPDKLPTNKLAIAAFVGPWLTFYLQPALAEMYQSVVPTFLAGPSMTMFVTMGATSAILVALGYSVPDRAGYALPRKG